MRRLVTLVTVVIAVCLTASVALAGMRVNSITFQAVPTVGGGTGLLTSASSSTTATTVAASQRAGNQGACAAPCIGMFLHADGTLVGLGQVVDTVVVVEATGIPVVTCTNLGGNQAPGQNPPKVTTAGAQQIGITQITKNGAASIDVTTGLPDSNVPGSQMGCPNDNWTAEIVGIQFTNADVTVYQNGVITLQQSYVF